MRRVRRYRNYSQNGAGIFDIIKKAGKFLGSKKARKILEYGRKGLDIAEKAQRGIAGFTGQNGGARIGRRKRGRGRGGYHPITASQVRQLELLLGNNVRSRGGKRRRGRLGRNQRGGFISWLIKQFM